LHIDVYDIPKKRECICIVAKKEKGIYGRKERALMSIWHVSLQYGNYCTGIVMTFIFRSIASND
jgi:hypothetical protein